MNSAEHLSRLRLAVCRPSPFLGAGILPTLLLPPVQSCRIPFFCRSSSWSSSNNHDRSARCHEKRGKGRRKNSSFFSFETSRRHQQQQLIPPNPLLRHRPGRPAPAAPVWRPQRPRQNIHEPLRPPWLRPQVRHEVRRLVQDEGHHTQGSRLADKRDQGIWSERKRRCRVPFRLEICASTLVLLLCVRVTCDN